MSEYHCFAAHCYCTKEVYITLNGLLSVCNILFQLVAGQSEAYWDRFWSASGLTTDDFFELITPEEIRNLRDNASGNLTTLCFKVRKAMILRDSEILLCYCSWYSDCHWLHPLAVLESMSKLLVWDHMIHFPYMYRILE